MIFVFLYTHTKKALLPQKQKCRMVQLRTGQGCNMEVYVHTKCMRAFRFKIVSH